jgi:taurine dioxygenase
MKRFDVADRPITGYETIGVTRLTPTIGATLDGIDLSRPISEQQLTEVKRALAEHLVIFFRDQKISIEQHKDFGRRFGELHVHPVYGMKGHPEVLEIKADENSKGVAGEAWHTDVSCDAKPPAASILYMHEVPANGGGDTLFANMYAAWETLSEPVRKMLDGLRAVHDGGYTYGVRQKQGAGDYPVSSHPIGRTHPVTGRKALYVNSGFTTRIEGLRRTESDAILQMLFRHIELDDFKCRFHWAPGSIAFWDNRCAQHLAVWDYFPHRRYGHRVTIAGDTPV